MLHLTDESAPRDHPDADPLERRLLDSAAEATGHHDYRPLRLFARDGAGAVQGGLLAETWAGWLYVHALFVEAPHRGAGLGGRLLDRAEAEAARRGCTDAFLETFAFQARPFYEARGYRVVHTLEDFPPGHAMHTLHKRLDALDALDA